MQPNMYDDAIRREVLATLKVNPAASLDTVLGNWRYHRHGAVTDEETVRVTAILQEERSESIQRDLTPGDRPWWRLW
jgi:hypothetical protein